MPHPEYRRRAAPDVTADDFDDAVAWAASNRADPAGLRELAKRTVDAYSAYDIGTDGAKRDHALDLLALANRDDDAAPLVAGFAFWARQPCDAR